MDPQILMQINEIYRNEVYSEPKPADINQWVSQLISEGYNLDQFSDEELYEAYLEDLDEAKKTVMSVTSPSGERRTLNTTRAMGPARLVGNPQRANIFGKIDSERRSREGISFTPSAQRRALTRGQKQISTSRQAQRNSRARFITRTLQTKFGIPDSALDPQERSKGIPYKAADIHESHELDLYDIVSEYLVSEGFCDSYEEADVIMVNMSEEWRESIMEEVLQEDEAWRERNFRPMEPYKQEKVHSRLGELSGKTFSAHDELRKLNKKPLKRFRPGLKKRILSTANSVKTSGRLATRAGESLIRQSHHDEKQKRNKISALKSIVSALEDGEPQNSIRKFTREELDLYNAVSDYLVSEGFCDSYEDADVIMVNMSEEWRESIVEEVLDEGKKNKKNKSPKVVIPQKTIEKMGRQYGSNVAAGRDPGQLEKFRTVINSVLDRANPR